MHARMGNVMHGRTAQGEARSGAMVRGSAGVTIQLASARVVILSDAACRCYKGTLHGDAVCRCYMGTLHADAACETIAISEASCSSRGLSLCSLICFTDMLQGARLWSGTCFTRDSST